MKKRKWEIKKWRKWEIKKRRKWEWEWEWGIKKNNVAEDVTIKESIQKPKDMKKSWRR